MTAAPKVTREPVLLEDPARAIIPEIRQGELAAVYYGQRSRGDFYDFVRASPLRVLFGLFDIAGKLEQTRGIELSLQEEFRAAGSELLQGAEINESQAMMELWLRLNQTIMKVAGVHSCPAFLACYNEDLATLTYVNAGHTPGLVKDQGSIAELSATALPLGLFSHSVPDASVIAVGAGHMVLLVSRGIVEAQRRREEFGLEGAKEYLRDVAFDSAHETCVGLLSRVRHFMGTAPNHNDVTALALVRSRRAGSLSGLGLQFT